MAGPAPWRAQRGCAGISRFMGTQHSRALSACPTQVAARPSSQATELQEYPALACTPALAWTPSWKAPRVGERPELESAPSWRARRVELSMKQDRSAPRPRRTRASSLGIRAAPLRCGRRVRAEGQSRALARPSIAPAARAGRWARLAKRCLVAAGADGAEWLAYR